MLYLCCQMVYLDMKMFSVSYLAWDYVLIPLPVVAKLLKYHTGQMPSTSKKTAKSAEKFNPFD